MGQLPYPHTNAAVIHVEANPATLGDFLFRVIFRNVLESIHSETTAALVRGHNYQLDFLTPGMCPSSASSRKQMRHKLKSRIKPRGRPHLKQRRTVLEENLGFFCALTTIERFAIRIVHPRSFVKLLHRNLAIKRLGILPRGLGLVVSS